MRAGRYGGGLGLDRQLDGVALYAELRGDGADLPVLGPAARASVGCFTRTWLTSSSHPVEATSCFGLHAGTDRGLKGLTTLWTLLG
jgi:hypothetical protein